MGSCGIRSTCKSNNQTLRSRKGSSASDHSLTPMEESFLSLLFQELCQRNNAKKSLEKSIFLQLVPIPVKITQGLLGERIFGVCNTTKSGFIYLPEFLILMSTFSKNNSQTIAALFKACDLNENGLIEKLEFKKIFFLIFYEAILSMRTGAGEEFLNPTKHEGCLATFSSASSNLFKNKNDPDEVIEEVFLQYANGSDSMNREEFAEFIKAQSWLLNKIKEWFKVDSWTTGIKLKLKNPEDFFFSPHLNFTVTAEVSKGKEFFNVHLQLKETFLLTFNENKVLSEVYFIESCKFKAKSKTLSIIYNTLSDQRLTLTFETEEMCQKVKQALEKAGNYKNFKDFYSIGEKIGSGEFASVYLCSEISTGEKFVVKIIKKWKMDKNERDMIKAEIEILNHCCGIAAARLKEVFDTHKNVKIVMEYLSGTDLYTKIKEESTDEVTVKQVIRKTLKNLEFLHLMGVMHRDIKPENLLVHDKNDKLQVRFLDFGLSTFFLPGEKKRNQYGTLSYMAPEVLKGRYCEKIDVWSVGVVLYVYLSGKLPFSSHSQEGLLELIKNEEPNFELELWEQFSLEAKEFTKALLNKNPELRPSCEQALKHKWMSD